jgi:type II secretory pathway component PulF
MPPDERRTAQIFEYRARRTDGGEAVGRLTALDELDLDRQLAREGLVLVEAHVAKGASRTADLVLPTRDLVAFSNQLATMLQAGLPLLQALQHLGTYTRSKDCRKVVESILRRIEGGESLSEALAHHQRAFPSTYVAMVKSGELSTALPDVLRRQGAYLEWLREVKGITKQALIYPSALCFAVLCLIVILVTFLIPRLVALFPGGRDDLPDLTKFVLGVSSFVTGNWVAIVVALAALGGAWAVALALPRSRRALSRALLRLPRLGSLVEMVAISRFATTASALHKSGCDILKTLEISGASCGNAFLSARFEVVLDAVRGGEPIHVGMERAGGIDPYLVQLTAVGESSGRLGECLENLADGYNAEVPRVVKWALSLVEPAVVLGGGLVVAFLLLAAILPIFKIYETLG